MSLRTCAGPSPCWTGWGSWIEDCKLTRDVIKSNRKGCGIWRTKRTGFLSTWSTARNRPSLWHCTRCTWPGRTGGCGGCASAGRLPCSSLSAPLSGCGASMIMRAQRSFPGYTIWWIPREMWSAPTWSRTTCSVSWKS